ncbi:MAG: hypothetical protein ACO1N0_14550 [Fluviicola sp.]
MKNLLLAVLILLPLSAFAHGEEVLLSLFYDLITVIALLVFILCIKWKSSGKSILGIVLIVSAVIPFMITSDWPYRENRRLIDSLHVGIPLVSVLVTFFLFRRKFSVKSRYHG